MTDPELLELAQLIYWDLEGGENQKATERLKALLPAPSVNSAWLGNNRCEFVTNGSDKAVKVIVLTEIADDTRRCILLRMALTAVTLAEHQVSQLTDEDAEAMLDQIEAETLREVSKIITPPSFNGIIVTP